MFMNRPAHVRRQATRNTNYTGLLYRLAMFAANRDFTVNGILAVDASLAGDD